MALGATDGATRRSLACVTVLAMGLLEGCTGPIAYPRTASVQDPGKLGVRVGMSAYATAVSAYVAPDPDDPSARQGRIDSDDNSMGGMLLAQSFVLPATAEPQPALGIADGLELGALGSTRRLGMELRGQLLDEHDGAPLSLALSGAGTMGWWAGAEGPGGRVGLDASGDTGTLLWMVGAYVGLAPARYEFDQDGWLRHGGLGGEAEVQVDRREVRLSVPLGLALGTARRQAAFVLGVVPEWTLSSELGETSCNQAEPCILESPGLVTRLPITDFEQHFELFVTLGIELGTLDPEDQSTAAMPRPYAF